MFYSFRIKLQGSTKSSNDVTQTDFLNLVSHVLDSEKASTMQRTIILENAHSHTLIQY